MNADALRTTSAGRQLIRERECVGGRPNLKAYLDGGGVWTIGFGHTRGVKRGQKITDEQAEEMLTEDIAEAEATIRYFVDEDVLDVMPAAAWDALVSFVFNLGRQAFRNPRTGTATGVQRALNMRDWKGVAVQLSKWVYDNGKMVRGLAVRRASEISQWQGATWPTNKGAIA